MLNIFQCIYWAPLFFFVLLFVLFVCFFACLGGTSSEKCLFDFFTHFFKLAVVFLLLLSWTRFSYILDTTPLSDTWFINVPFGELFFHFVDSCFCCEEIFSLMQSHLLIFAFCFLPQKIYILACFFFSFVYGFYFFFSSTYLSVFLFSFYAGCAFWSSFRLHQKWAESTENSHILLLSQLILLKSLLNFLQYCFCFVFLAARHVVS